jgi:hypothetical protein
MNRPCALPKPRYFCARPSAVSAPLDASSPTTGPSSLEESPAPFETPRRLTTFRHDRKNGFYGDHRVLLEDDERAPPRNDTPRRLCGSPISNRDCAWSFSSTPTSVGIAFVPTPSSLYDAVNSAVAGRNFGTLAPWCRLTEPTKMTHTRRHSSWTYGRRMNARALGTLGTLPLERRSALAELPSVFSEKAMMQHVSYLASTERQGGRSGAGESGDLRQGGGDLHGRP